MRLIKQTWIRTIFIVLLVCTIATGMISACYATEENQETNMNTDEITTEVTNPISEEYLRDGVIDAVQGDIALISEDPMNEIGNTNNTYNDDIFQIQEGEYHLTQNVNGNIYVLAEKITLTDVMIDGNVFLMANDIDIENTIINGTAYIGAENIVFNGQANDVYILGSTVNLNTDTDILRNAYILGDNFTFKGAIGRNLTMLANQIQIADNTIIGGKFSYMSSEETNIPQSAHIADVHYTKFVESNVTEEANSLQTILTSILTIIVKAVVIALFLVIANTKLREANKSITTKSTLKTLGIGLLTLILCPIIALICFTQVFGLSLGIILLFIYISMIYVSKLVASFVIASVALKEKANQKVALFIGTAVIYLVVKAIEYIPIVGSILSIIAVLLGLGYIVISIFSKKKTEELNVTTKEQ